MKNFKFNANLNPSKSKVKLIRHEIDYIASHKSLRVNKMPIIVTYYS